MTSGAMAVSRSKWLSLGWSITGRVTRVTSLLTWTLHDTISMNAHVRGSTTGHGEDSPLLKRRRLTMNTMTCEDGIHELTIDDLDKVAGGDSRPQHLTLSSLQDDFITMMAEAKAAGEYK